MMEGMWPAMQHQRCWFVFKAIQVSPMRTTTSYAPSGVTKSKLTVDEYPIPVTRMLPKPVAIELGIFAANTQN